MLTQPSAQIFTPGIGFNLVPEHIWKYFSSKADATVMLERIKALAPDAVLYDGLREFGIGVMYLDADTKIWTIKGAIVSGDKSLVVWENAGWLFDRMTYPNIFVDRNPDSTLGGPELKYTDVDGATAQLSWGK